jgi:uncharacterized protein YggL (DUF469 family)
MTQHVDRVNKTMHFNVFNETSFFFNKRYFESINYKDGKIIDRWVTPIITCTNVFTFEEGRDKEENKVFKMFNPKLNSLTKQNHLKKNKFCCPLVSNFNVNTWSIEIHIKLTWYIHWKRIYWFSVSASSTNASSTSYITGIQNFNPTGSKIGMSFQLVFFVAWS